MITNTLSGIKNESPFTFPNSSALNLTFLFIKKISFYLNKNDVRQNLLVLADVKMKNPRYDNQRESEELRNRYRELRRIIYSRKNDDIEAKVNSAISELETFIKPYIHG